MKKFHIRSIRNGVLVYFSTSKKIWTENFSRRMVFNSLDAVLEKYYDLQDDRGNKVYDLRYQPE